MKSTIVLLGGLATSTVALSKKGAFVFPAAITELEKRQMTDDRYKCHENCGYALQGTEEEGFCDDAEWNTLFEGCLDCALEFNIWQYYGNGLTPAAESCGLDATPHPVDGGEEEPATTSPPPTEPTSSVVETPQESTPAPEPTATGVESSAVESTPAAPTSSLVSITTSTTVPTVSSNETAPTNGTTTTPPAPTSQAVQNWVSSALVAGAAIILTVNLM